MAIVVLQLDEEFQVAMARTLVEAPQCALVAIADPNSRSGHFVVADTYDEGPSPPVILVNERAALKQCL